MADNMEPEDRLEERLAKVEAMGGKDNPYAQMLRDQIHRRKRPRTQLEQLLARQENRLPADSKVLQMLRDQVHSLNRRYKSFKDMYTSGDGPTAGQPHQR